MATDFSIPSLFERAFGINRGKPYDPSKIIDPNYNPGEPVPQVEGAGADDLNSEFVQVRNSIGQNLPTGQPLFMPVQIGGLVLPNEPTIYIFGRKNVVETSLVGSTRRGTVKELIGVDDYSITIRGIAINYDDNKVYPEDQVKAIHDLYLQNESLEIQCGLTSLLGIYRVVIKHIALPEMIGIQHAQAYELQCVSDEDFLLEID